MFFHVNWTGHIAETSPFVGYTILALATICVGWLRRDDPLSPPARWLMRVGLVTLAVSLAIAGLGMALGPGRHQLGGRAIRLRPQSYLTVAFLMGLGVLAVRGWDVYRRRAPRS